MDHPGRSRASALDAKVSGEEILGANGENGNGEGNLLIDEPADRAIPPSRDHAAAGLPQRFVLEAMNQCVAVGKELRLQAPCV
jgi:hypothetical protein